MNNEPVAWMSIQEGIFSPSFKYLFSETEKQGFIPLYTHPVKEQDTDCQYCKQGCIRCDARKQLTDEEITELGDKHLVLVNEYIGCGDYVSNIEGEIEFARAILRKAQEK